MQETKEGCQEDYRPLPPTMAGNRSLNGYINEYRRELYTLYSITGGNN